MSFIGKLKKLFTEEKVVETAQKTSSFEDLKDKLDKEMTQESHKNDNIIKEVRKSLEEFINAINESINNLKNINLDERKAEERLKVINKDNLMLYVSYLEKLILDLNKIEEKEVQKYIIEIFNVMNDFNKKSHLSFEKATILIGKEMAETKDKINSFAKNITEIFNDNKEFFNKVKLLKKIEDLYKEFEKNNIHLKEIDTTIENSRKNKEKSIKEQDKIEEEIIKIKESDLHKKELKDKEDFRENLAKIDKKIESIRDRIDLKSLSSEYHSNKKIFELIKEYSSNFKEALNKDKELKFIEIVRYKQPEEADKLLEVNKEISQLKEPLDHKVHKEIIVLEEKLKYTNYKIKELEENIAEEIKKQEKIIFKQEILKDEMTNEFKLVSN